METVKIELELSVDDVEYLNEELSNTQSSYLTYFLENILKEVAKKTNQMIQLAYDVKNVNTIDNIC